MKNKIIMLAEMLERLTVPRGELSGFTPYQLAEYMLKKLERCSLHPDAEIVPHYGCEECLVSYYDGGQNDCH